MTRTGNFGIGLKEIQIFNTIPTSFQAIRDLVVQFEAEGQVTKEGATRLLQKVDQAEKELQRGSTVKAIQNLQAFIDETASLPIYVPGEEARFALIDEAEQMIAQLGGVPTSG